MLHSIAVIVLAGLLLDAIASRLKAPGLLGLLLLGLLMGPFALNALSPEIYAAATELRTLALLVILLRAGFEMNRRDLAMVGWRAILMSFIPCFLEVAVVTLVGPLLLPLERLEAATLGAVLAAVSPAVIVPYMIRFNRERLGTAKGIPTLVLAGASCDDAVAIVLATSFIGMLVGQNVRLGPELAAIPVAVATGIAAGLAVGAVLFVFFRRFNPRATKRLMILLSLAVLLVEAQAFVEPFVPFSALIAIMAIGVVIFEMNPGVAHEIAAKLAKTWIFAQLLLFVLIGAQVDVGLAVSVGFTGAAVVAAGLVGRSLGVLLCLVRSSLTWSERLFVVLAYWPKATVQAAIGALPLGALAAAGLPTRPGEIILAMAVLSILLTAPLGAFLIDHVGTRVLEKDVDSDQDSP